MEITLKPRMKRLFFGSQRPMNILFGLGKGIRMIIDPLDETQLILGLYEFEIASLFKKYAIKADVFLDIGSAKGYYSLIYRKFHPEGYCYLIDADPKFAEKQLQNLHFNNINKHYEVISKYVSAVDSGDTVVIDKLLKNSVQGRSTIFAKIDVEGAELEVLKGMRTALDQHDCVLIIETHSEELERECIAFLKGLNYKSVIIKNSSWRRFLKEGRILPHNRWLQAEKIMVH